MKSQYVDVSLSGIGVRSQIASLGSLGKDTLALEVSQGMMLLFQEKNGTRCFVTPADLCLAAKLAQLKRVNDIIQREFDVEDKSALTAHDKQQVLAACRALQKPYAKQIIDDCEEIRLDKNRKRKVEFFLIYANAKGVQTDLCITKDKKLQRIPCDICLALLRAESESIPIKATEEIFKDKRLQLPKGQVKSAASKASPETLRQRLQKMRPEDFGRGKLTK